MSTRPGPLPSPARSPRGGDPAWDPGRLPATNGEASPATGPAGLPRYGWAGAGSRRRTAPGVPVPASSGWYWLLAFTGLAATMVLMGGLSSFLGWPAGSREPFLLALGVAAALAVLANVPLAGPLLVAVVAARTGWLALVAPERLAELMLSPFPGATAAAAGGVLRELWLGTYERLPAPLLVPGTLVVAVLHVALVLRAARRPATALAPVVAGGLAMILAWFYGRLPRPDGWPAAYLVLSLAFTGLARLAEPAGAGAWPPAAATRRWWEAWARRWWDPRGLWSTRQRPPAAVPDPGLQEELVRRPVPLRLLLPGLAQALAVVLVAALIALQLPPRQEALDWVPLTRAANRLLPFTAADRPGGWGAVPGGPAGAVAPRQYLGGPFFPSAAPVLTVAVEGERLPRVLYLRGATRLYYDGRSWGEPVTWPAAGHWERALDLAVSSPAGSPDTVSDDGRVIVQRIEPRVPLKDFLYAVLEPRAVNGYPLPLDGIRPVRPVRGLLPLITADRTLLAGREWGRAPYTVRSVTPEFDPAAIRAAARRAMREGGGTVGFVPPAYLQLPEDLPERVRELAYEVTRGRDNPYDMAKAIESYLRGFRYDLNMPYTPEGRDFVDYFLFDLQRGYCTAFASAAVVMLRSIGLPARWVEGFVVPIGGQPGTYTVTPAQAHAWVEVLIPGYGWVPLEPTPAYPERPLAAPPPATAAPAGEGEEEPDELPTTPRDTSRSREEEPAEPATPETGSSGSAAPSRPAGAPAAAVVAILLALAGVLVAFRRRGVGGGLPGDPVLAARALFARTERELARLGFPRAPHMTPREYARWLARRLPDLGAAWLRLAELYEQARYGTTAPAPPAPGGSAGREEVERLRAEIVAGLTRAFGWRYRWVHRAPDPAAVLAPLAEGLGRWTRRHRWTRMGGEGRSVGLGR